MIRIFNVILFIFCFGFICSCSSELDFGQVDDVVLRPQIEADILFFTLGTESFIDSSIPDTTIVVRDKTRVAFLDNDFIKDKIKGIEFSFQVDNSFLQSFNNRFIFLNAEGEPQYVLEFTVASSLDGLATRTSVIEQVNKNELEAILNSIYIVNELGLNTNGSFIKGEISFQSKALYSLEVNDF